VGDVHGRLDALDALVGAIRRDARTAAHAVLVMLGDYVDRGPASRQVIERLVELGRDPHLQTRFVRGNHDDTMLNFLADPAVGPSWCGFGGVETLRSYGVTAPPERDDAQGWADVSAAFRAAIPDAHVRFLQALEPWVEYGDYFFTHAGVRPGVALAEQDPNDLMWIRETFLRSSAVFSKTIVHGHTPEPDAFISDRRIGVDTGAFATGRLTAVALEGAGRRLIQVRVRGADIFVEHIGVARQGVRTKARGQARA
jgi:serine/threonine protein phosphatase 1